MKDFGAIFWIHNETGKVLREVIVYKEKRPLKEMKIFYLIRSIHHLFNMNMHSAPENFIPKIDKPNKQQLPPEDITHIPWNHTSEMHKALVEAFSMDWMDPKKVLDTINSFSENQNLTPEEKQAILLLNETLPQLTPQEAKKVFEAFQKWAETKVAWPALFLVAIGLLAAWAAAAAFASTKKPKDVLSEKTINAQNTRQQAMKEALGE